MALVSCTECGRQVSTNAVACPACGNPAPAYRRQSRSPSTAVVAILGGVALLAVLVAAGTFLYVRGRAVPDARMDPGELVEFMEDGNAEAPEDRIYDTGEVSRAPALLNRDEVTRSISRVYPPLLRDSGVTGEVELWMVVETDGTVAPGQVEVVNASHPLFGEAAASVVPAMRFRPAALDGVPVRTRVTLPVTFLLED